jgi:hypothetical protein
MSHSGVEQVFRPAVKRINPPALAAEVQSAQIHHTKKAISEPEAHSFVALLIDSEETP